MPVYLRLFLLLLTPLLLLAHPEVTPGMEVPDSTQTENLETDNTLKVIERKDFDLRFGGYMKMWWTLYEEVTNDVRHPDTGERAAEVASGFNLYRARFGVSLRAKKLRGYASIRLDSRSASLLDAFAFYPLIGQRMELWGGQMKIPSTYEIAISASKWDFLTRSRFSELVVDYSLARGPTLGYSSFYDHRATQRDLGVALKGKLDGGGIEGNYFLMVSNGLGTNFYIGGKEKAQSVLTNNFGEFLYAARFSIELDKPEMPVQFRVGGHVNRNKHSNMLLIDGETVTNIDRTSWSVDAHASILDILRLTGMYGDVLVDDDIDNDGVREYAFDGWEVKAMAWMKPDVLEVGVRYDTLSEEFYESGRPGVHRHYTVGVNYTIPPHLLLQANYKHRHFESDASPDINENVFILSAQIKI